MLKRTISSMIGIAILLAVYLLKNNIVFNVAIVLISIIGLNEFYHAVRQKGIKPIETIGYLFCILIGFAGLLIPQITMTAILVLAMPTILLILAIVAVMSDLKLKFVDVATTILGIIYVPLMMLFLIFTWQLKNGYLLVWFIFGGAWMTDTFAYLIGKAIGKHKFSKISPNKSIEGCIGGLLGGAIFYGVYSLYLNANFMPEIGMELNIVLMTFIGMIVSVISQVGDFFASAIKRNCEIKDFGAIMPGHGGVLDRFDSIIMITPFVYLMCEFII